MDASIPSTTSSQNGSTGPATAAADAVTKAMHPDEIALYDRQIRLWGVQAQEKIRNANILLVSMKALAGEIAKNLVLAGIGSLTVIDHETVTEDDLGAQFFITDTDVGLNRAEAAAPEIQKLNPRVRVSCLPLDVRTKANVMQDFLKPFDVVVVCDMDFATLSLINASTRLCQRPFYAAGVHGFYGYIFADLIQHDFVIQRDKSNIETKIGTESTTRQILGVSTKRENDRPVELVTKREMYSPLLMANSSPLPVEIQSNRRRRRQVTPLLSCIRAYWEWQRTSTDLPDVNQFTALATEKHRELQLPDETLPSSFIRDFLQNIGSELAPVTAFIGGQLAQDVINVLGNREQPIQNLMLFDGEASKAPVYAMHPIFAPQAAPTVNGNGSTTQNGTAITLN